MQRVWQGGPKGADSVRAATSAAGGSPVAASSIADYAAYSLRKAAAPEGVLDPRKYAQWVKTYDGALSARPDIRAQFDTAADAQRTLNKAAEDHAVALRSYQNSVARHFSVVPIRLTASGRSSTAPLDNAIWPSSPS